MLLKTGRGQRIQDSAPWAVANAAPTRQGGPSLAVDETVILLHPPLPLAGVSIVMERERQHDDSLVNGGPSPHSSAEIAIVSFVASSDLRSVATAAVECDAPF